MSENDLVKENMGLVFHIAKKFKAPNETEREEYVQVGLIALLRSIRKHQPEKGKLTTIAWLNIVREISRYIKKNAKFKHSYLYDNTSHTLPTETLDDILPNNLSDAERKIVVMKNSGYSLKEIQQAIPTMKPQQIAKQYKKALSKIKKAND